MSEKNNQIQRLATTIRMLAADGVEKAKSGHPGMPMGAADYASVLWSEFLRFNPEDPNWPARDRFVLSAGHGSMLLYSLLHLFGFNLPMSELQRFRQWASATPGHPEFGYAPGVETTTGPLGQGFGNGVGMALSAKLLAAQYGELFNYRVFGIVSDGDLMEGVASEAASIAGHLGLNNLIYFYDDNQISIGGHTGVCFTENVPKRFEAYNWFAQSVDGHDVEALRICINRALQEKDRPCIICCRTTIGFGSPNRANDPEVHGAPLGPDELEATRRNLNWPEQKFFIPDDVKTFCAKCVSENKTAYQDWQKSLGEWSLANPEKAGAWQAQSRRALPSNLKEVLVKEFGGQSKKESTRSLLGKVIQVLAKQAPYLVGGSADLEPSTKTLIKGSPDIQAKAFSGRNIRFGVREHGMGAVVNGLAYTGYWFPYSATFLVFSDYMRPSIRLAALSKLQSIFIFTHDSFFLGEDGPTHQPIEHLASLRLIPNLKVYRPADGLETALCYYSILEHKEGPSVLLGTRQDLPVFERRAGFSPDEILNGAYLIREEAAAKLVIVATGSEVWVAAAVAKELSAKGIPCNVVSMPCQELFLAQEKRVQEKIIPPGLKKVSIEAGTTYGWERIVGSDGLRIGIDHFGASAPAEVLAEKFGFTPEEAEKKISSWFSQFK